MSYMTVQAASRVFLVLPSCSDSKLGESREQQPNLCLAFLTGVFLGHVFFDTSPSNLCVSAHKTRYCADQTWHVLWVWLRVWLHWSWGEAQITSSLQVVDLLCFLIEAQLLQPLFFYVRERLLGLPVASNNISLSAHSPAAKMQLACACGKPILKQNEVQLFIWFCSSISISC